MLAVATRRGLVRVSARRTLYATGAYDQNLPFADNDRPGVIAARALRPPGVPLGHPARSRPSGRVVILDAAPTAEPLARARGGRRRRRARRRARATTVVGRAAAASGCAASSWRRARGRDARPWRATWSRSRPCRRPRRSCRASTARASRSTPRAAASRSSSTTRIATVGAGRVRVRRRHRLRRARRRPSAAGAAARARARGRARWRWRWSCWLPPGCAASGCAAPAPPPRRAAPGGAAGGARRRPSQPPPFAAGDARHAREPSPTRAPARGARSWTRPGEPCATSTTTRRWAASTGTRCAPSTSRSRSAAPSDAAFYRVLNQMIGELGQSHMLIVGPGAEDDDDAEQLAGPGESPPAHGARGGAGAPARPPGLGRGHRRSRPDGAGHRGAADDHARARRLVRRPRRPGARATSSRRSPAARWARRSDSARPLRPVEERFAIRRAAQRRLLGPPGTRVSISYLDDRDKPGNAVLVRDPPRSAARSPRPPAAAVPRGARLRDRHPSGVIAFNVFLVQPIAGGDQARDGALRLAPRARGGAGPARQPGRPRRDGDPGGVAVRDRAGDAGDAARSAISARRSRRSPRWGRCRSPDRWRS